MSSLVAQHPLCQVGQPASQRHRDCHGKVRQAGVKAALGFAHVQDLVKVVVHPIEKQVLEIADGGVTERQQNDVPVLQQ